MDETFVVEKERDTAAAQDKLTGFFQQFRRRVRMNAERQITQFAEIRCRILYYFMFSATPRNAGAQVLTILYKHEAFFL